MIYSLDTTVIGNIVITIINDRTQYEQDPQNIHVVLIIIIIPAFQAGISRTL